ncbi:MAG TPA: WD40 repeat domain-containing protein [Gemmatimonadaceae bacterium]|nr:WD40 repeat domain-containing protein [Gemmatimonadaceae bacterium]
MRPAADSVCHPLITRDRGWETGGVINSDGKLLAYAVATAPLTKSEIWVSHLDGSGAQRVSGVDEDALLPAFGGDTHTVYYLKSTRLGHSSPIASERRHNFDVMSVSLDDTGAPKAQPVQLTRQQMYDVSSLAISADGKRFLLSVNRYPKGSVLEEYDVDKPQHVRATFQPHVKGEVSNGPIFGEAAYARNGQDLVFIAATGGFDFNYNIYELSATTGGDIVQLTQGEGIIESFAVDRDGTVFFRRAGHDYRIDPQTHAVSKEAF